MNRSAGILVGPLGQLPDPWERSFIIIEKLLTRHTMIGHTVSRQNTVLDVVSVDVLLPRDLPLVLFLERFVSVLLHDHG